MEIAINSPRTLQESDSKFQASPPTLASSRVEPDALRSNCGAYHEAFRAVFGGPIWGGSHRIWCNFQLNNSALHAAVPSPRFTASSQSLRSIVAPSCLDDDIQDKPPENRQRECNHFPNVWIVANRSKHNAYYCMHSFSQFSKT